MPKTRNPNRSKQVRHEMPAERLPEREEVERAIDSVLDRLRPKPRRPPKAGEARPERNPQKASHLSLVRPTGDGHT